MCNGSNVNFPGDRALSGLIQKWEQEERKNCWLLHKYQKLQLTFLVLQFLKDAVPWEHWNQDG